MALDCRKLTAGMRSSVLCVVEKGEMRARLSSGRGSFRVRWALTVSSRKETRASVDNERQARESE